MKVKILRCCAGLNFSFVAGDIVDIDDVTAKDLIQAGHAEEVKSNAKGNHASGKRTSKSG
jgi:hypothetical protein